MSEMNVRGAFGRAYKADVHPDAGQWDDPATHKAMCKMLADTYDGYAIAMVPQNLRHYLQWVPTDAVIAVWNTTAMPTDKHPRRAWEPVVVVRCDGRKKESMVSTPPVLDLLRANVKRSGRGQSFAGAKPAAWTRWVLDMLGYDPETDTVHDLFPGSGAVAAEISQGVLL